MCLKIVSTTFFPRKWSAMWRPLLLGEFNKVFFVNVMVELQLLSSSNYLKLCMFLVMFDNVSSFQGYDL
jgi:hypothetical protein